MNNIKIIAGVMIMVFALSFASAGWFDFLDFNKDTKVKLKDTISNNWIKTYDKIFKWKEDKTKVKLKDKVKEDKTKVKLKDKVKEDKDKETELNNYIEIKENDDGVKAVYNAG